MKIHVCTPYDVDKNLSRAYNEEFERCPDGDWLAVRDQDTLFLTPDAIKIMYDYVKAFPETGIFTAFCNRIHPLAVNQLFLGTPSNDFNIDSWQYRAKMQAMTETKVTEIRHPISGFLMLISKKTWSELRFTGSGCLGVDNDFSDRVLKSGKKIFRMDRIVMWHSYRIENIRDKSHLMK